MNKIQIHRGILIALLIPHIALAQAAITEIMYDPAGVDSGHEWIEVYNMGTSSIPLTTWKVYEGGANHNIISASGDKTLAPGTYAAIAASATKFQSDYPNFSGELFHSAISLDNGGEMITIRDKSLTDIDSVTYDSAWGAVGDGNSLQRGPGGVGAFMARMPTPGGSISSTAITPKAKSSQSTSTTKTPKQKKSATMRTSTTAYAPSDPAIADVRASNDAGNMAVVAPQVGAVARSNVSSYAIVALGAILILAIGAIAASRHIKKTEWDIVEESPEDV